MNAGPMIDACFRHQWPELYGREEVPGVDIPNSLRYGTGDAPASAHPTIAEEPMGNGEQV